LNREKGAGEDEDVDVGKLHLGLLDNEERSPLLTEAIVFSTMLIYLCPRMTIKYGIVASKVTNKFT
jgi:hypothetical protein